MAERRDRAAQKPQRAQKLLEELEAEARSLRQRERLFEEFFFSLLSETTHVGTADQFAEQKPEIGD